MFLFTKRPLAFISAAVLLFLFAAPHLGYAGRLVFAAVFLPGVFFFALAAAGAGKLPYPRLFGKYSAAVFLLLFLLLLSAAVVAVAYYDGAVGNARSYRQESAAVTGYAEGDAASGGRVVVITSVNGSPVFLRAYMTGGGMEDLSPYGCFSASGVRILDMPTQGSVGAYGNYYQNKGVFLLAEAGEVELLPEEAHTPGRFFFRINRTVREWIFRYVPENAGFVSALTLGNRDDADDILQSDFRKIGVSHLLALSGMHFTAMLFGIEVVLQRFRLRKPFRYALMLAPALLYMGVAGFPLSLLRAGILYLFYRIAYFCGRRGDGVTSLLFAAAMISLVLPASVYDIGFILSVSAALAIILFAGPAVKWLRVRLGVSSLPRVHRWILDKLISGTVTALSVLLFIVPVSALCIGTFSTASVPATLLISLFITPILYIMPFLLLFSGIPGAASLIGRLMDGLAGVAAALSHKLAVHNYTVSLTAWYVKYILILFFLLAIAAAHQKKWRRRKVVLSFLLCAVIFTGAFAASRTASKDKSELVVFSDGRGDVVLCISDNRVLVCDETAGSVSLYNDAVAYLQDRNITKIDTLLFTHVHETYPYLLKSLSQRIHIGEAIFPADRDGTVLREMTGLSSDLGISCRSFDRGDGLDLSFGDVSVSLMGIRNILWRDPSKTDVAPPLRFRCGDEDVVFAPDGSVDYMRDPFSEGGTVYVYGNHLREVLPDFSFPASVSAARAVYLPYYADEDYLSPDFADFLSDAGVFVSGHGPVLTLPLSPAPTGP